METNAPEMTLNGEVYVIDYKNSRIIRKNNPDIVCHWNTLTFSEWDVVVRAMDEALSWNK